MKKGCLWVVRKFPAKADVFLGSTPDKAHSTL